MSATRRRRFLFDASPLPLPRSYICRVCRSWLVLVCYIARSNAQQSPLLLDGWLPLFHLPLAVICSCVLGVYYVAIRDHASALLAALLQLAMGYFAPAFGDAVGWDWAWAWALGVQAASWAIQVGVGHYAIEGNSPGMADQLTANSVVLSVLLAVDWGPPPATAGGAKAAGASKGGRRAS